CHDGQFHYVCESVFTFPALRADFAYNATARRPGPVGRLFFGRALARRTLPALDPVSILLAPFRGRRSTVPLLVHSATVVWVAVAVLVVGRGLLAHNPDHVGIYATFARGGADWATGRAVYPAADGFDVFR